LYEETFNECLSYMQNYFLLTITNTDVSSLYKGKCFHNINIAGVERIDCSDILGRCFKIPTHKLCMLISDHRIFLATLYQKLLCVSVLLIVLKVL